MSLFLIDDQGEMWRGDSRQLRLAFDTPFSGGEFIEYAVRNLGFVAINIYGRSCQLRIRPTFLAEKAAASLIAWLTNSRIERVVLTTYENEWRDELVLANQSIERLKQLLDEHYHERPGDFLSRKVEAESLASTSTLNDVVRSWPSLTTTYEPAVLLRLLRATFDQRYVVVKKQPEQSRIVFNEFGEAMFTPYETWRMCAIGAPIEEQPDRVFGRWLLPNYLQASERLEASVHEVDAIVRWPDRGRIRQRYRRLIFPLPPNSDGQLMIGGSIVDTAIDLRVATG